MSTKTDTVLRPPVMPSAAPTQDVAAAKPTAKAPTAAPTAAPVADKFGQAVTKPTNALQGNTAMPEPVRARASTSDWVTVSTNNDDPFVLPSHLEKLPKSMFELDANGKPLGLKGPAVSVEEEDVVYKQDPKGAYIPFANNPWTAAKANQAGNFNFDKETRFPIHTIQRDADGKAVLDKDGKQIWDAKPEHLGQTTSFEALNFVKPWSEGIAGRPINWGTNGQMPVNPHAFIGYNAFFSPTDRALYAGVVPYRLPGEKDIKMFETASSWEIMAHEAGHAIHHELKPNIVPGDVGFRQWGESFADQNAMWSSLSDPTRVKQLIAQTHGNMNQTNNLSEIAENFAQLIGEGTALRDGFQNKTVKTTTDEVHDRSEVLTGAAYKVFIQVYKDQVTSGKSPADALAEAGKIMGTFSARATDFTPEDSMTFEDVAKAYLSVDKEYFGGKYHDAWASQFTARGVFDDKGASLGAWQAHEDNLPKLSLAGSVSDAQTNDFLAANLDKLAVPAGFGLKVQSITTDTSGQKIIRATLTQGTGADAKELGNHALLTFRKDGSLMELQPATPPDLTADKANELLAKAREKGLDKHGALVLVKPANHHWTVKAFATEAKSKMNDTQTEFTLEKPTGTQIFTDHGPDQRDTDLVANGLPPGARILTPDEMANL